MAHIKVSQSDGEIVHFDGDKRTVYKVAGGEIVADDAHVGAVLANVPGSELLLETPAKKEK